MIAAPSSDIPHRTATAPLPGGWRDAAAGGEEWVGQEQWTTKHGPSTVLWSYGRPIRAWGVHVPDGRIASAEIVSIDCWRLWVDGESMLGEVVLQEDSCSAAVLGGTRYRPPDRGFEADLWSSRDFRALIRKAAFIGATHAYLSRNAFRPDMRDIGRTIVCDQEASVMLSRMRGWGTARLDTTHPWFAFEPHHTVVLEEILEDIGWHALTPEEYAIDHARALDLLDRLETRRDQSVPVLERPNVFVLNSLSGGDGPFSPAKRMMAAIRSGRCHRDDLGVFLQLLDVGGHRMGADPSAISSI